jgi:hypothetical protein
MYQLTFGNPVSGWRSNKLMRQAITQARRFVLDDAMSAFLADIDCSAFKGCDIVGRALHQMKNSSRLPHDVTWVEFSHSRFLDRQDELPTGRCYSQTGEREITEGWLLNGFDRDEDTFRAHVFQRADGHLRTFPLSIFWRTDEQRVPGIAHRSDKNFGRTAVLGLSGNDRSEAVETCDSELLVDADTVDMRDFGWVCGVMRRVWAFLATVNDLPVTSRDVRPSKGFMARAQYRRFLEHKVITLDVPHKESWRMVARNAVAVVKRRAHMVRGHWRKDWRTEGGRIWVKEHQRGDASIGFVTHDYEVRH